MEGLACRACGAPLSSSDLDRRLAIVTCAHCGGIFDLARRTDRQAPTQSARFAPPAPPRVSAGAPPVAPELLPKEPVERAPVPLPDGFRVEEDGRNLRVQWRWFRPRAILLAFFCVGWNSALVSWYWALLGPEAREPDLLGLLFPVAHVAVGLGLTYYTLALFLNTSTVAVNRVRLRIQHAPLPWRPTPNLSSRSIEQLYVMRHVSNRKNGLAAVTYDLRAVTREDRALKLLGGLDDLHQALWLEQEIERQLDIRDRPVAGEVKGDGVQI